jgi:hypothetical protein
VRRVAQQPLGTVKADPGRVVIVGRLGPLWHIDVTPGMLTDRERFDLIGAAEQHGHPSERLLRAGAAAAKAAAR